MMPDVAASIFRGAAAWLLVAGVRHVVNTSRAIASSCMANWRNIVPKKMKPALLIQWRVRAQADGQYRSNCTASPPYCPYKAERRAT